MAVLVACVAMLAGCDTTSGLRDRDARISATTRFDPAEMQGTWIVRERFAIRSDAQATSPERFEFAKPLDDRFAVTRTFQGCDDAGCTAHRMPQMANRSGPGRFVMPRANDAAIEHWVLWTDADYRVAAIGTPSGGFGWIMTQGPARDDLMQAAREIMDWNGYDLAMLRQVAP